MEFANKSNETIRELTADELDAVNGGAFRFIRAKGTAVNSIRLGGEFTDGLVQFVLRIPWHDLPNRVPVVGSVLDDHHRPLSESALFPREQADKVTGQNSPNRVCTQRRPSWPVRTQAGLRALPPPLRSFTTRGVALDAFDVLLTGPPRRGHAPADFTHTSGR